MKYDYRKGIADGLYGRLDGYCSCLETYYEGYLMGRRIAAGAAGLTIKEANLIKMLGGFILQDLQVDKLKRAVCDCINQLGEFEEVFYLAEMGGASEAV